MAAQAGAGVIWAWGQNDQWYGFEDADSQRIEQAFSQGQQSVDLLIATHTHHQPITHYRIEIPTMNQVNLTTGFRRSVRRFLAPDSQLPAIFWEWADDNGVFHPYDPDVSALFEGFLMRGTQRFSMYLNPGQRYKIDLAQSTQKNSATSRRRSIRRMAAGGVPQPFPGQVQQGLGANQPAQGNGAQTSAQDDFLQDLLTKCRPILNTGVDDICAVCLCGYTDQDPALRLPECTAHHFHKACIIAVLKRTKKCAICSKAYGLVMGDMPDGTMQVQLFPSGAVPLTSYENEGTIVIHYSFSNGIQGPNHPNPGASYVGTKRTCYLPDTSEGQEVLRLLRRCFDQKLMFTIGRSITTGLDNRVIWNGVHMKTNIDGGPGSYGYPDPAYFSRVKQELALKGIR